MQIPAPHRIEILGQPFDLSAIRVKGDERVGGLYRYEVFCKTPAVIVHAQDLLRQRALLTLGCTRPVWGQVSEVQVSHQRGVPRWRLVLEPRLAALSEVRLNQVFLHQSSVQTVQALLAQCGLSGQWQDWRLQSSYPAFAQRTCQEQTALDFLLWLLELEGIGLRFVACRCWRAPALLRLPGRR